MPEGDTVWRAARTLHNSLAGARIEASDLRVPAHATADLRDWRVLEVVSAGKHLLMRLDHESRSAPLTLHTHLGMDGRWIVHAVAEHARNSHRTRVVLRTNALTAVGHSLPVVELMRTADEHKVTKRLGPDCLGENWNLEVAVRNVAATPQRNIGSALLDQRNLAGVGNVFRSELLFIMGVHPSATVADVPNLELLIATAAKLLQDNRERVVRNTTGLSGRGRELFVYGRTHRNCRRCTTPIALAEIPNDTGSAMERVVFWCPRCQLQRRS